MWKRDKAKMLNCHPAGERCNLTFCLLEAEFGNELSPYLSPNNYCNWRMCVKTWKTLSCQLLVSLMKLSVLGSWIQLNNSAWPAEIHSADHVCRPRLAHNMGIVFRPRKAVALLEQPDLDFLYVPVKITWGWVSGSSRGAEGGWRPCGQPSACPGASHRAVFTWKRTPCSKIC